jgi:hypothetical protein
MNDDELVAFIDEWDRRIARLQRTRPELWCVFGLSDDEVRDAITLRLIEQARAGECDAWTIATAEVTALRKRFRVRATPADLRKAPLRDRAPDQEAICLDREDEAVHDRARRTAESSLDRPQRRWLAAMKMAANAGAFFDSSDALNLSAAARVLGKNRSSAKRAYAALRDHFQRELDKIR